MECLPIPNRLRGPQQRARPLEIVRILTIQVKACPIGVIIRAHARAHDGLLFATSQDQCQHVQHHARHPSIGWHEPNRTEDCLLNFCLSVYGNFALLVPQGTPNPPGPSKPQRI
eukprot:4951284-Amphidinium_carterae.2